MYIAQILLYLFDNQIQDALIVIVHLELEVREFVVKLEGKSPETTLLHKRTKQELT